MQSEILVRRTAASLALLCVLRLANAGTVYWTGGNGSWGTASSWTSYPFTSTDDLIIGSSFGSPTLTSIASGTFVANSLTSTAALAVSGGSLSLSANSSAASLSMSGGSVSIAAGKTLAFSGASTFSGGTLGGGGVAFNGGLDASAATQKFLGGNVAVTLAAGTVSKVGGTLYTNSGGGTLASAGSLALQSAGLLNNTAAGTLNNSGALTSDGASSIGWILNNTGSIAANSGKLTLTGGGTNSGTLAISSGATVEVSALTLTATSLLSIGIDGSGFGKLIGDSASLKLGGTLTGLLASGAPDMTGTTYRFLTGSYTGTFSAVASGWGAIYGTNYVDLVRTQAVPEPASFAVLGLGALAFVRRRTAKS